MNEHELLEFNGLKWKVIELRNRIDAHNLLRKKLMKERRELLKEIDEAEKRYYDSKKNV